MGNMTRREIKHEGNGKCVLKIENGSIYRVAGIRGWKLMFTCAILSKHTDKIEKKYYLQSYI